jgi:hypothetical protein
MGLRLYVGEENTAGTHTGLILDGVAKGLKQVSASWNLVAVTARWGAIERCRTNTEKWFAANIDVPIPVFYAEYPLLSDAPRGAFKSEVIKRLKRSPELYGSILAGVGDRPSDMEAYVSNGMHALMITDEIGELGGASAHAKALRKKEEELGPFESAVEYFETRVTAGDAECCAWEQIIQRLDQIVKESDRWPILAPSGD